MTKRHMRLFGTAKGLKYFNSLPIHEEYVVYEYNLLTKLEEALYKDSNTWVYYEQDGERRYFHDFN